MNKKEQAIRDALLATAKKYGPDYLLDGTVTAVDSESYLCDVELDIEGTIPACRLRATAAGNSSVDVLPVVGSSVVIAKITAVDYLVLCCDKITSYRVTVGDFVLTVDQGGFTMTNGTVSLGSILNGIITQLLSIYAPKDVPGINELTTQINQLLK